MHWSHADEHTYRRWLTDLGFQIIRDAFIPQRDGGHVALLAQEPTKDLRRSPGSGGSQ